VREGEEDRERDPEREERDEYERDGDTCDAAEEFTEEAELVRVSVLV